MKTLMLIVSKTGCLLEERESCQVTLGCCEAASLGSLFVQEEVRALTRAVSRVICDPLLGGNS